MPKYPDDPNIRRELQAMDKRARLKKQAEEFDSQIKADDKAFLQEVTKLNALVDINPQVYFKRKRTKRLG